MAVPEKVLLTGATGFVGANLAGRLVREGFEVHLLTRATSQKWRIAGILEQITEHTVDLTEGEKLAEVVRRICPQVVFHLATSSIYAGKHLPEAELVRINLLGTMNLLQACAEVDYRCFINTGSSSEYGPKTAAMSERDVCEPVTMYGITKLAAALSGQLLAKTQNKPVVTLRLFSPYGPYDDARRLMAYALARAWQNQELKLANPTAVRDYIYVDDVVDLYMKVIPLAEKYRGEIFNVGSGRQTTVGEAVQSILTATHSRSRVVWNSTAQRAFDVPRWEAEMSKTFTSFDWKPTRGLAEGIRLSADWFRNNLEHYPQ